MIGRSHAPLKKDDLEDPIAPLRAEVWTPHGQSFERMLLRVLTRRIEPALANALLSWTRPEDVLAELREEMLLALETQLMVPLLHAFSLAAQREAEDMGIAPARKGLRLMSKGASDAAAWLPEEQRRLARTLSLEQERAIRMLVGRARESGYSAARLRHMIVDKGVLGLDQRGVNAVFNMMRRDLDSPLTTTQALVRAEEYTQRLIVSRANTIARTEMSRAIHQGKIAAWRDAARYGRLRAEPYVEWVADGRPCPVCMGLDGIIVRLGDGFAGVGYPPDPHPNCMCTLRLVDSEGQGMRPGKVRLGRRQFSVGRPRVLQAIQTYF